MRTLPQAQARPGTWIRPRLHRAWAGLNRGRTEAIGTDGLLPTATQRARASAETGNETEDPLMAFKDDIRELMRMNDWDGLTAAKQLGVTSKTICDYRSGKATKPFSYALAVVEMKLKDARELEYQRLKTILGK